MVDGRKAFEEDSWKCVQINNMIFTVGSDCTRCKIPTVNQETGEFSKDGEPTKTLETFRKKKGEVAFGRYIIPEATGEICVGDYVHTLGLFDLLLANLKRYRFVYYVIKKKLLKKSRKH